MMSRASGGRTRSGSGEGAFRLTPKRQALAEQYLPLAKSLAWRWKQTWPSAADDFESRALLALVKAAHAFEPSRNIKFATFARRRIEGELRDLFRRLAVLRRREHDEAIPLDEALESTDSVSMRVVGYVPDPPVGSAIEEHECLESWLRQLPPRHAEACRLLYQEGLGQVEAARVMGIAQSRLCALHRQALGMLNGTWDRQAAAEPPAARKKVYRVDEGSGSGSGGGGDDDDATLRN